ncbi:MAG: helix-turn-helix transcriptional regulator [Egibacteraceae bacterium]
MSSVQETLRSQRERLGQSRATAAARTKLPDHVPAALESGQLALDDATTLAYVRIYARHLGLDAEELLRDCAVDEPFDVDEGPMLRRPPRWRGLGGSRVPLGIVLGVLGLACLVFAASIGGGDAGGPVDVKLGASSPGPVDAVEGSGRSAAGDDDSRSGSGTDDGREGSEEPGGDAAAGAAEVPGGGVPGSGLPGSDVPGSDVPGAAGPEGGVAGTAGPEGGVPGAAGPEGGVAGTAGLGGVAGTAGPGTTAVPGADTAARDAPAPTAAASPPGRAPGQTRVQLLHHGGIARPTVEEVHAVLQSLGYQVTHVNLLPTPVVGRTTVQAVEGWMVEAEALRQRDPRFGNVEPNRVFSTEVDLHVIIGTDWPGQV